MRPKQSVVESLEAIPEPWEHNPSSWNQRVRVALLASVAFFVATYMGLYQWRLIGSVWDPIWGPQTMAVLDSDVSHELKWWFRMPDAIFGAGAYLGDIIFAMAGSTRRWQYRPWLVVLFGIDVIPLGIVSAVLVFLQGATVGAWCALCIFTAIISLILVVLAYDEVWSCLRYLYRVWQNTGSKSVLFATFWGKPSPEAQKAGEEMLAARMEARHVA